MDETPKQRPLGLTHLCLSQDCLTQYTFVRPVDVDRENMKPQEGKHETLKGKT